MQGQEIYDKTKEFVINSFKQAGKESKINHLLRTVDLVNVLKPDAGISLLTAAISHDIEKAFRESGTSEKREIFGLSNPQFFRDHEEKWAEIIWNFLNEIWAQDSFVQEVIKLVARHEEGWDTDQNILQAADSISFFEDQELANIEKMLKKEKTPDWISKVKAKVEWMYQRIQIPSAKEMAKTWYEKALKIMENF